MSWMVPLDDIRELAVAMLNQNIFATRVIRDRLSRPHDPPTGLLLASGKPERTKTSKDQHTLLSELRPQATLLHTLLATRNGQLHGRWSRRAITRASRHGVMTPYAQQVEYLLGMRPYPRHDRGMTNAWPWHSAVDYSRNQRYPTYDGPEWWPKLAAALGPSLPESNMAVTAPYTHIVLSASIIRDETSRQASLVFGGILACLRA